MWTRIKPNGKAPRARESHTVVAAGTKLFFFGGSSKQTSGFNEVTQYYYNDLHEFDTQSFKFKKRRTGSPPSPRTEHTLTKFAPTKFLLFGGSFSQKGYSNETFVLNSETWKWTKVGEYGTDTNPLYSITQPNISGRTTGGTSFITPTPRHGHTMNLISSERLLLFGGYTFSQGMGKFYNDTHIFNTATMKWSYAEMSGHIPEPRDKHTLTSIGNNTYALFGGHNLDKFYSEIYFLDAEKQKWTIPVLNGYNSPNPRDGHSMIFRDNRLLLFGGSSGGDNYLNDIWSLDPREMIWQKLETRGQIPSPRSGQSMIAVGNKVFCFGGVGIGDMYYNDLSLLLLGEGSEKVVKTANKTIHAEYTAPYQEQKNYKFNSIVTTKFLKSPKDVSQAYFNTNTIDFLEAIPDGFYDPGRGEEKLKRISQYHEDRYTSESSTKKPIREVIMVNAQRDKALDSFRTTAIRTLQSYTTLVDRIKTLALLVSDFFGGSQNVYLAKLSGDNVKYLMESVFKSRVVPIGAITFGVCRHRAILFKYLADFYNLVEDNRHMHINCKLVRGVYLSPEKNSGYGGHVWNVVRFYRDAKSSDFILDLTFQPLTLIPAESWRESGYFKIQRMNNAKLRLVIRSDYESGETSSASESDSESVTAGDSSGESSDSESTDSTTARDDKSSSTSTPVDTKGVVKEEKTVSISSKGRRTELSEKVVNELINSSVNLDNSHELRRRSRGHKKPRAEDDRRHTWEFEPGALEREELIGIGSNSIVYKSSWCLVNVVIKEFVSIGFGEREFRIAREEIEELSNIRHPNCVQFIGSIVGEPRVSVVYEYMENGSLREVLQDKTFEITSEMALRWAIQIAKALNYLLVGSRVKLNPNLKTSNILVSSNGMVVKLSDYGMTRTRSLCESKTGKSGISPAFLAPENLGASEGSRASLKESSVSYSFGVVLWEIITRQIPFSQLNSTQIILGIASGSLKLEIPQNCPKRLKNLIERCWDAEANFRPSFSEIVVTLEDILKNDI